MKILTDPQAFWNSIDTERSPRWPVICVDFNGVLDTYTGWNGYVEYTDPAPGALDFIKELSKQFKTIVIFTATIPLDGVVEWLERNQMAPYIAYVTNWKVPAAMYVDDKAVTHSGNFADTLDKIRNFKPWWKDNGNA